MLVGVHAVRAPGGAANQHKRAAAVRRRKCLRPIDVHCPQPERQRGRIIDPKRVGRKILRLLHDENRTFGDSLFIGIGKHKGNDVAGLRTLGDRHPRGGLRFAFTSIENDRYLVSADLQYILFVFVDGLPRQRHVNVGGLAGNCFKSVPWISGNHEFRARLQVDIIVCEPLCIKRLHRSKSLCLARLRAGVCDLFAVAALVVEHNIGPCALRAAIFPGKISGILAGIRRMAFCHASAVCVVLEKRKHRLFRAHPLLRFRNFPVKVFCKRIAVFAPFGTPYKNERHTRRNGLLQSIRKSHVARTVVMAAVAVEDSGGDGRLAGSLYKRFREVHNFVRSRRVTRHRNSRRCDQNHYCAQLHLSASIIYNTYCSCMGLKPLRKGLGSFHIL